MTCPVDVRHLTRGTQGGGARAGSPGLLPFLRLGGHNVAPLASSTASSPLTTLGRGVLDVRAQVTLGQAGAGSPPVQLLEDVPAQPFCHGGDLCTGLETRTTLGSLTTRPWPQPCSCLTSDL